RRQLAGLSLLFYQLWCRVDSGWAAICDAGSRDLPPGSEPIQLASSRLFVAATDGHYVCDHGVLHAYAAEDEHYAGHSLWPHRPATDTHGRGTDLDRAQPRGGLDCLALAAAGVGLAQFYLRRHPHAAILPRTDRQSTTERL